MADGIGFHFDNSYAKLPEDFFTRIAPVKVSAPRLVVMNHRLGKELGLQLNAVSEQQLAEIFSGNILPDGASPLALAYAGHQFGNFARLGDGRAHLIGELLLPDNRRVDIQLKGSGQTPYSRRGDGRAALAPMLREYIISEAMVALGIPTTRSLAVVTTGDPVYRENIEQGAILTRIAASHIRVGTFEYLAARSDIDGLRQLADYTIHRHYPEIASEPETYLALLNAVIACQITLIVGWLRVGFIHGVMNTDNMAISGETIDYGPCAFMDAYNPSTVFSSIDHHGRYAYANQPHIAQWNLARFAESLLPLLHEDVEQASVLAENSIQSFAKLFQKEWLAMMRRKLGLFGEMPEDEKLIADLLQWMQKNHADYTNIFDNLSTQEAVHEQDWWQRWQHRLKQNNEPLEKSFALMRQNNPVIIPRNHRVEEALSAAQEGDMTKLHRLLDALRKPYQKQFEYADLQQPPAPSERVYQTFCGT